MKNMNHLSGTIGSTTMTFEEWLEEEFPSHDVYDHETLSQYDRWKKELKLAFEGGYSQACYDVVRGKDD